MLAALLLIQAPAAPAAEANALLKEMRLAKTVEVRHVDGDTILARKIFKPFESKGPVAGTNLLVALQNDLKKGFNDNLPRCGFHADAAIVTKGKRTLKTELCFGCGVVQVEIPGPPMRRQLSWMMNDKVAMRKAVHEIYPGVKLGR